MRAIGLLLILLGIVAIPAALIYFNPKAIRARKHRRLAAEERELRQIETDLGLRED